MAPSVRKPLTLGFVGAGVTSAKNAVALLTDLIEADSGKAKVILPATADHWTEGIEAVADFALEKKFPLVLVTDDSTNGEKGLKGYVQQATETVKVINPVNKVVKLTAEGNGKLIMLWDDEDDDCYNALELAEEESIEALDLTAGLHRLEFTGDSATQEEQEETEDETQEPEAEDDLDDMSEEDLQDLAESMSIDVEAVETWDEVRDLIRALRAQEPTDDDEPGLPTADEILEWDFDTLKKFAQEQGVEVPPRSKTSGYRKAVQEFLQSAMAHLDAIDREQAALDGDDGDLQLPDDDEPDFSPRGTAIIDMTPVKEEITAVLSSLTDLHNAVGEVREALENIGRASTEHMIEIRTAIMEMSKPGTIQAAQQKATKAAQEGQKAQTQEKAAPATKTVQRPAKAATKAAPAKRQVNRPKPTTKPGPTDTEKERPLAPFMHLLGKKLTRAQAKEIVIASTTRGRGRPTEDERTLIAAAKEIVPQV